MRLKKISIINYKNIKSTALELSPKVNCFIGNNGEGKTNILDAVYFLSFCHSNFTNIDSIRSSLHISGSSRSSLSRPQTTVWSAVRVRNGDGSWTWSSRSMTILIWTR